jgi:short-subunit dehydrogenase
MAAKFKLKPIDQQVILITGASSGIGLTTARQAAQRGAKLVLVARSEKALRQLEEELNNSGHEALAVVCDVGKEEDMRHVVDAAIARFGGFDTWVNDAGVAVYGKLLQIPMEDHHRVFQTNLWGTVHGSLLAARHLRDRFAGGGYRGFGGAIVNIGSVVSDRAMPLLGMYSASKQAVKGFTDALRMELEHDGVPVSVTLIKPGSINSPFTRHAKNYMEREAEYPPPVYAPDVVARTILYACEHPEREVTVGGGGKLIAAAGHYAPRLTDRLMEGPMYEMQKKDRPREAERRDSLFAPSEDLSERGDYEGMTRERSFYTAAARHPWWTGAILVGAGLAAAVVLGAVGSGEEEG